MATEYLGVKQVAERLGITSGGLLNLKLPEPDAMIGRTRGWLSETIDGWNAKRPGRGVGGGRPPKKQVTGIRGWLRTNDLRFWRPPLYPLSYAHRRICESPRRAHLLGLSH